MQGEWLTSSTGFPVRMSDEMVSAEGARPSKLIVRLWLLTTESNMTTSCSKSPLRQLPYCGDNVKTLYKLSKCCWCRCRYIIIRLQFNDCRNPPFKGAVLPICFTEVVSCMPASRWSQLVNLHLLLSNVLHLLQYRFGDCPHHPAGFVILAQLALLCLFLILIFPIFPMVGNCKITQIVSNSNHYLLKCVFGLAVC